MNNFLKSGLFLLIVLIWFVALLLILLRRFIAMNRLQKIDKKNAEYFKKIYYGTMGLREEESCVGGKTRLLTDLVLEQEKKYIEALSRLPASDKKNFILRSLRHGEAIERKNNIVCEEYNKFGAQIVAEKKEIEDQNLYFDNIAFPYDELVEMRRLGRFHCTAPSYFVSFQRPDSYKEDKPDET